MNRLLAFILFSIVIPQATPGQRVLDTSAKRPPASEKHSQKETVGQTLKMMTEELVQAYPKRDSAALDRILADDLTVINPDGSTGDKAGEIGGLRSGKLKLESVINDEIKVRVFGETAVVTGRATIRGQIDEQVIHAQNRYTSVFLKRRGRWQVISLQLTQVAQQR